MRKLVSCSVLIGVGLGAVFCGDLSSAGEHSLPGVESICRYLGVGYSHRGYHAAPRGTGSTHSNRSGTLNAYWPPAMVQQSSQFDELPPPNPSTHTLRPCVPKASLPNWTQAIPTDAEQQPPSVPHHPSPAPKLPPSGGDDGLLLLLNSAESQLLPKRADNRYRQWEQIDHPLLK